MPCRAVAYAYRAATNNRHVLNRCATGAEVERLACNDGQGRELIEIGGRPV